MSFSMSQASLPGFEIGLNALSAGTRGASTSRVSRALTHCKVSHPPVNHCASDRSGERIPSV